MTTTILIVIGIVVLAVIVLGQTRQEKRLKEIDNATNYLRFLIKSREFNGEIDALRCVNPLCQRRNTPDEEARKQLGKIAETARRKKYAEEVEGINKEAAESANEPVKKEAVPFCGDCKVNQFCEKALNIAQPACDNFELDDNH